MRKTLGSYIRFVPKADQETIVQVLSIEKPHLHRGMLCFISIDEILDKLRNSQSNFAMANQTYAIQQARHQHWLNCQNWMASMGGGIYNATPLYPPGITQSPPPHLNSPPQDAILFAYAAVVTARALMMKDLGVCNESDTTDDEQTPDNAEAGEKVA